MTAQPIGAMFCWRCLLERDNVDIVLFDGDVQYEPRELEDKFPGYRYYYIRKHSYFLPRSGREMFMRQVQMNDVRKNVCEHSFTNLKVPAESST